MTCSLPEISIATSVHNGVANKANERVDIAFGPGRRVTGGLPGALFGRCNDQVAVHIRRASD
jgi:hypothetical protein